MILNLFCAETPQVGCNGYIAAHFWKTAEFSRGVLASLPLDAQGRRIPLERINGTLATGLPVEYALIMRYLRGKMR